ncbi:MAG: hypothetical protein K0Q95_41 [Bacteroidota bacterium]|jgi:hypothetical protein|nr:hypothetical protein [Bacteroidota bacterium]
MISTSQFKFFSVFILLVFIETGLFAQTSKPHFEIKNAKDQKEAAIFYNSLKDMDLEQFRFYSERRVISCVNSAVTIELYSAKELLDLYQRPVHDANIRDNKALKTIEFIYYPEAGIAKAIIKN